jgi:RNA polymerase sigma factor (sigma-70 family)
MDDLILNNVGLIKMAIKQLNISTKNVSELEEYYGYGMIGLIRGAKTYDKSKKIAESTYLTICIKHEIMKSFKLKTTKKRFNEYGEISLDDDLGRNVNFYDIIPNDIDIEKEIITKIRCEELLELLETIKNERYIRVIKMYYGIGCQEKTLSEIAKELGVSITRASGLRKAAIRRLREMAKKEDI